MGWWRCEHGTIGDEPADVMGKALNSTAPTTMCNRNLP